MRLAGIAVLLVAASACATEKPATQSPGAFEKVAERMNDSHSLLGLGLSRERKAEIDAERNPVDRRDGILVATRIREIKIQRRLEREAADKADKDKQSADAPHDRPPGKYQPQETPDASGAD